MEDFQIRGSKNKITGKYRDGECPHSKTLEITFEKRTGTGPINTLEPGRTKTKWARIQEQEAAKRRIEEEKKRNALRKKYREVRF